MNLVKLRRRPLVRTVWQAIRHFLWEDGFVVAGYVAFTALFAMFPFLIFLLALAGWLGQGEAASASIELGYEIMPSEVVYALRPAVEDIRNRATPGLMTFSIAFALWFASSGMESVRHALERAYNVERSRSFVMNRLQSMVLTILTAGCILLAITAIVAGPAIQNAVEWLAQRQIFAWSLLVVVRYTLGLFLLLVLTVALHRLLPAADIGLADVLPGSLLSVVLWAIVATLYSAYLHNFAQYSVTYGSLGGVVLTLFFFYLSACIFIFGAQINGAVLRVKRLEREKQRLEEQAGEG